MTVLRRLAEARTEVERAAAIAALIPVKFRGVDVPVPAAECGGDASLGIRIRNREGSKADRGQAIAVAELEARRIALRTPLF